MGSMNPKAEFDNLCATNPDAKNALEIVQKYGNGDPRTAFMNYAKEKAETSFANNIMNMLGLK